MLNYDIITKHKTITIMKKGIICIDQVIDELGIMRETGFLGWRFAAPYLFVKD